MFGGNQFAGAPFAGTTSGATLTKLLTEALSQSDAIIKVPKKLVAESISSSDTFLRTATYSRLFTESITPISIVVDSIPVVNPKIRFKGVKQDAERVNVQQDTLNRITQKDDILKIDLKR